jgi:hypothetical protein
MMTQLRTICEEVKAERKAHTEVTNHPEQPDDIIDDSNKEGESYS